MSKTLRSVIGLVAALLVVPALVTGCGSSDDDSPTAAEQVCTAREGVSSAVQKVVDDLKAGNLGDAKTSAAGIRPALDKLKSSIGDLTDEQKAKLQPQADKVSADLQGLGDATSLAELQTALTTVGTDVSTLVDSVKTDLDCSD